MPILAGIAVFMRFLARRRCRQPFGADDYAVFLGWVVLVGMCADSIYGVYGAGEGMPTMTLFMNQDLLVKNLKVRRSL